MIKAVFFDLYNTICYFDPSREERQQRAAREIGFDVPVVAFQRAYAQAEEYWTLENARHPIASRPESERLDFYTQYERYLLSCASLDTTAEQASLIYGFYTSYPRRLRLFDDALPTIITLRQNGIAVGLISNNDRAVEPICDELLLTPHLEVALSSIVFGCEKPDPRIFIEALRLANVEARDAVHVGDQYHSDARGAIAAGVYPILIDRYGLLPDQPGCARIANLWQLPDLLCALR